MHQYCEFHKDTYGWTEMAQEKADWIENHIREGELYYRFGCFEVVEEIDEGEL